MYTSLKQTYYDNSNQRIFSCFFSLFVNSKKLVFIVSIRLRLYGGLIGMKNCSLEKYLNDSKFIWLHAFMHDAAVFKYELELNRNVQRTVICCPGFLTHIFFTYLLTDLLFAYIITYLRFSYLLTHLLTDLLTNLLTQFFFTYSLTFYWLTFYLPNYSLAYLFTYLPTYFLTYFFTHLHTTDLLFTYLITH